MDAQTLSDTGGRTGMRSSFESQDIEPHRLRFTGSGGEYFRVWIVNVLLSIVTLGFYTPWARRRTAQYFYGHTLVAGSPLEFTAQQRRMVVGFLVVALLTLAYNIASNTGQDVAVGLFILGGAACAWPSPRTGARCTPPAGPCSRWPWSGWPWPGACRRWRRPPRWTRTRAGSCPPSPRPCGG
jgi:hypothetical protein